MIDNTTESGESCSYWDCGDLKSPWAQDHVRAPGEVGICKPRKTPCALDMGKPCGMYSENALKRKENTP